MAHICEPVLVGTLHSGKPKRIQERGSLKGVKDKIFIVILRYNKRSLWYGRWDSYVYKLFYRSYSTISRIVSIFWGYRDISMRVHKC